MASTRMGSSERSEQAAGASARPAMIFAAIDLPEPYWPEFHDWYETEHIPERRAAGLNPITRWERHSGALPRFLALSEARALSLLQEGSYAELKRAGDTPWTARLKKVFDTVDRGLFVEVSSFGGGSIGSFCAVALTTVPESLEQPYGDWYDGEHGPAVAGVPGVLRLRRLVAVGGPPQHLSIVDLAIPDVLLGEAYGQAKAAYPGTHLREHWQRRQALYSRWRAGDTTGGR